MTTPNLRARIARHEGERLKPYKDSEGIWTIGDGHNIEADPDLAPHLAELEQTGISQALADKLLDKDIAKTEAELDHALPWWRKLDDVRQDVVVEMGFNMGVPEFSTWHHTLGAVEAGQYKAAGQMILHSQPWASQVGPTRAGDLATMMSSGQSI